LRDPCGDSETLASFWDRRCMCSSWWILLNSPIGSSFKKNILDTLVPSMSRSWTHMLALLVSCGGFVRGLVVWGAFLIVFLLFGFRWVFMLGVLCFSYGFSFCSCFRGRDSWILLSLDLSTSYTQICIYVWNSVGNLTFLLYLIYSILLPFKKKSSLNTKLSTNF